MNSIYQFNTMTKFLIGPGAGNQVGPRCQDLGCTKVLIVDDEFTESYAATIKRSLEQVGIDHVTYSGVVPDPTDVSIMEALEIGQTAGIDGVIGIGGGSGMDTAKAVNLLLSNPHVALADIFAKGGGQVDGAFDLKPGLPLILIPSTAGTGAESTYGMVLTDTKGGRKMAVVSPNCGHAALAVIDPVVTHTMPPSLTAATGMDAMGQAFEGYTACARLVNPISDLMAVEAIRLDYKYLPLAVQDGNNEEARWEVAKASMFSGIGMANSFCHLGHSFAHTIGGRLHIPHGLAVGAAEPEVMEHTALFQPERVRDIGLLMGAKFSGDETPAKIGAITCQAIHAFKKSINLPNLKDLGFSREQVVGVAEFVKMDPSFNNRPYEISDEQIAAILNKIYDACE